MSALPDLQVDHRLFDSLVAAHRAAFERLSRRLAGNAEEAEDLLQETLVDAYRGFHGFRPDTRFYSWVARIMSNNHLDRVRRKRHPVISLDQGASEDLPPVFEVPDHSANPERVLLHDQLDSPYQSALDALQPIHRATVQLCDLDGATYEEAAAAEECPVGTIRSRLHRAHKALRGFLDRIAAPEPEPVPRAHSRRAFLRMGTAMAATAAIVQMGAEPAEAETPLSVVVWAPDGTGAEAVRAALHQPGEVELRVATTEAALAEWLPDAHVLLWLGGATATPALAARVAERVRDGMGLIAIQADIRHQPLADLLDVDTTWVPRPTEEPVTVAVTAPRHPIAQGVQGFVACGGSLAAGPLPTARPEMTILAGQTRDTQRISVGAVWTRGRGRIFLFQPGEFGSGSALPGPAKQVFGNAIRWCARRA